MVAEILEHCIIKILGVIDCGVLWDAIIADDILPKKI
jgi:hypothetical protein